MSIQPITVGELRAAIKDLPDDMSIVCEFDFEDSGEFFQLAIDTVDVEARCDEIDALYVWLADPTAIDSEG
jgi:hypothetical protein